MLRLRARVLGRIRAFFAERGIMEVETPTLSQAAVTDPNLHSFALVANGAERYLHTSPEFPMKRLLAAGSGDIYQICKVFRADEAGRHHNPEFSLLEWYRLGFDHHALMDEVEALLAHLLKGAENMTPVRRLAYYDAFAEFGGLDAHRASVTECAAIAAEHGLRVHGDLDRQPWLELIMSQVIVPACSRDGFTFIYDFPAEQAALARVRADNPPLAERFELVGFGLELANGFHELTDSDEQGRRFARELRVRGARRAPAVAVDRRLLAALAHGLPGCAGVAVGLDRLLMLISGASHISEVMAFSWENA